MGGLQKRDGHGHGVLVDIFEISECDLAFGLSMRGGGEGQLHGDDLVVRHTQCVYYPITDGAE